MKKLLAKIDAEHLMIFFTWGTIMFRYIKSGDLGQNALALCIACFGYFGYKVTRDNRQSEPGDNTQGDNTPKDNTP